MEPEIKGRSAVGHHIPIGGNVMDFGPTDCERETRCSLDQQRQ